MLASNLLPISVLYANYELFVEFYDYTLKISLSALGLDTRGVSTSIDSELNGTLLRSVISKLRMVSLSLSSGGNFG